MITALIAATMMIQQPEVIRLWQDNAPGALGQADKDIPTLTLFKPAKPCGSAIVICPGGAYGALAEYEGRDYALWLNRHGVTAFVLKYRLGSNHYRHPIMLGDAQRALRLVRHRSREWGIASNKIGIMGSSAGGHLASTLATHFDAGKESQDLIDQEPCRPDFAIMCYAVITMGEFTHQGSKTNLLGDHPDPKLVEDLSNEKRVTKDTPPCFLWHTVEDPVVPVENSIDFALALSKNKVPYELHLYEKGGHGLGLGGPPDGANLLPWTNALITWLTSRGWAN